jgi:hypothetical protein
VVAEMVVDIEVLVVVEICSLTAASFCLLMAALQLAVVVVGVYNFAHKSSLFYLF